MYSCNYCTRFVNGFVSEVEEQYFLLKLKMNNVALNDNGYDVKLLPAEIETAFLGDCCFSCVWYTY